MNSDNLSVILREMARRNGLCDKWYNEWPDPCGLDDLLSMYVRGFDFCASNDYPPLDFIRENFSASDLRRHNVFVDHCFDAMDVSSGTYIFLGSSDGTLCAGGFSAVSVYARHSSRINVFSSDFSKCFVSYLDDSSGRTFQTGSSSLKVYGNVR